MARAVFNAEGACNTKMQKYKKLVLRCAQTQEDGGYLAQEIAPFLGLSMARERVHAWKVRSIADVCGGVYENYAHYQGKGIRITRSMIMQ